MTPAGFAKLGLRLLSLYVLFVAFRQCVSASQIFWEKIQDIGRVLPDPVPQLAQGVVLAAVAAFLWFRAENLARRLLPLGAGTNAGPEYASWQRVGLMFAGGLLCMQGLVELIDGFPLMYQVGSTAQILFALVLIIGGTELVGVLARLFSGRWRRDV
ncbi:MAG TPA: hypothetical protein VG839_03620 [Asticcacaulis sp.]|nr:hypothetical protein [Asticcacaulis sp.]